MRATQDPRLAVALAAALTLGPALTGCLSDGGPGDANPALALDAVASERTTAPGGTVAFPVAVGPNATAAADGNLTISVAESGDLEVDTPAPQALRENGTGVFVEVHVPEGTSTGDHTVSIQAKVGEVVGPTRSLTVHVEDPDEVVEANQRVQVDYVGRFANGSIFSTSVKALNSSAHPKAGIYSGGGPWEALNVTVGPNAPFIEGFNEGIMGVGVGHDATFHVPPSKGYGNATTRETRPRTETLNRSISERRVFNLSRERVAQQGLINESSEEGDKITVGRGEQKSTYNITFLNETRVELTLVVEVGDTKTHYRQWPDSSEAQKVNETHVEWYVTPTTNVGETYTHYDYWPDASKIVELTNETIVVKHSPEVGLNYTTGGGLRGQAAQRTVVDLTEDKIILEKENTHPLAGKTLVFDITVLSAEEASQDSQQRRRR